MEKLDLMRTLGRLYSPSAKEVEEVDVPAMRFIMVDGQGDPNTSRSYADAIEALFSLAYTLKFAVKRGPLAVDYHVMPPEGLWWADDMSDFATGDRAAWKWTMMIAQPDLVTGEMVESAVASARSKKDLAALPLVRFEEFTEGRAAQIMHVGPYSEEGPTIEKVHDFIARAGCERSGKHHEIYLSDTRKADPSKWKTVVRQPMR